MSESYEYAVRWGESIPGFPDVSRTVTTAEEAQAIIDGSAYPGVIVRRVVADWSEPTVQDHTNGSQ